MNHQLSPRYLIVAGLAWAGLAAAVIAGLPLLAVMVAPFAVLSLAAPALHRWPDLEIALEAPDRVVEGDEVVLIVRATSWTGIPWLMLDLELPPDLVPQQGTSRTIIGVPASRSVAVRIPVEAARWGISVPGRISATARDRFGFFVSSTVHRSGLVIRVHPRDGARRTVLVPRRLRRRAGNHASRTLGDGSAFAEVRTWRIGDPQRSINWRVSARRGEPYVTVRHPDQGGDLVVMLDSFRDIGPLGDRLVQRSIRAALALAESNLGQHDRVGLLDVGRSIRWYRPRLGRLHQARLLDALLETQVEPGLRAPGVNQLPLHDLGATTLVVFISGLIDAEAANLPLELRSRGLEVVVLECSPEEYLDVTNDTERFTARLWRLQRAELRKRLTDRGIAVATWEGDDPLELPIAALERRATVVGHR